MTTTPGAIPPAEAAALEALVSPAAGAIVSRTLARSSGGSLTLFAFDAGQTLSEHTSPFDAWVQIVSGAMELTIGGESVPVVAGEVVLMPAGVPHGLKAAEPTTMLLVMLRELPGATDKAQ